MLPLLTLIAGALGAAVASSREEWERKYELEHLFQKVLHEGTPDLLHTLGYVVDIFAIYIEDGYLLAATADAHEAVQQAGQYAETGDHRTIEVVRLQSVPREAAEALLQQGTQEQFFSDGYAAAHVVGAGEWATEPATYEFNRDTDLDFSGWPDHVQQEARKSFFEHAQEQSFPKGTRLFTGMAEDTPWEEDETVDSSEFPLTLDRATAEGMARKHAQFLSKVFPERTHQPRVISWELGADATVPMLKDEAAVERISQIFEEDFSDVDFEDLEDLGRKMEEEWSSTYDWRGWFHPDARGKGVHVLVLFDAPLKWLSTEVIALSAPQQALPFSSPG